MSSTGDEEEKLGEVPFSTLAMIRKPTIIITSLGRTGTKFFAALFRDLIPNATSLHEPDVFNFFQYEGTKERIRQTIKQIQEVGLYTLFVCKALGRGSIIELSDSRVRGELRYREAVRQLSKQRSSFVDSREGATYVESNVGYYGLLDILSEVFEHHRVAYIVRDGRDWVRSMMNWGQMYGKVKIRKWVAHTWPAASEIKGDPYAAEWDAMSRFERLCWAWATLNEYALKTLNDNPHAKRFRFEDIFTSEDRYQHLTSLVQFTTDMPNVKPIPSTALGHWLERKIHRSNEQFPAWNDWSTTQKRSFTSICGSLMEKLGYALD